MRQCGWMPREQWRGAEMLPEKFGSKAAPVSLHEHPCPGYLVRLPIVTEALKARASMEHGVLHLTHPDASAPVLEGAMLAIQAFNTYEVEKLQEKASP